MNSADRDAWDGTLLKDADTCLRLFYYKHVEGWRPRRNSVHLKFGEWYAKALELYHKLRFSGANQTDALRDVVRAALTWTWIDGEPWNSMHNKKNRDTLLRTIIWYIDQYGDDDTMQTFRLRSGEPAVELSFSFELADNLLYCGHIDRLVLYQDDIYVQDQKTTGGGLTNQYFSQWDHPEIQMSGYTVAGKVVFNSPVKGVVIDAASILVGITNFERRMTFRTPAQLDEFSATVHTIVDRTRRGDWPMSPTSCDKYGGCTFRSVCSADPGVRKAYLEADFEKGPLWDPTEVR